MVSLLLQGEQSLFLFLALVLCKDFKSVRSEKVSMGLWSPRLHFVLAQCREYTCLRSFKDSVQELELDLRPASTRATAFLVSCAPLSPCILSLFPYDLLILTPETLTQTEIETYQQLLILKRVKLRWSVLEKETGRQDGTRVSEGCQAVLPGKDLFSFFFCACEAPRQQLGEAEDKQGVPRAWNPVGRSCHYSTSLCSPLSFTSGWRFYRTL